MSSYRCLLRPTWIISSLQHKSKYKSKFNFELKKKTSQKKYKSKFNFIFFFLNQFLGFPWCSTRKNLSIDVAITIVGLILTKLRWFQLIVTSQNWNFELLGKNQIFELFWKKYQILGFPCCSTCVDLSIDVSITIVGLILTKLGWFQLFGTSQNSISNFFWKNSNFWVSMV